MNKKAFTRKSLEYLDKIPELDPLLKKYYKQFNLEYYDNSISKKSDKIASQIHKSNTHIKQIFDQTNARNRDLLSILKVTNSLDFIEEEKLVNSLYQEDKYLHSLKTDGYNFTLKELFEDFSILLTDSIDMDTSLYLLKLFYITLGRINREEKKFKKQEKINRKE